MRLAILSSHHGSNLKAIIDSCKNGFLNSSVSLVISNNSDSNSLKIANDNSISNFCINGDNSDLEILKKLDEHDIDLVILAGYMKKVSNIILSKYKCLNLHPSLLPKYGGKGMHGDNVLISVLKNKENVTGVTVHFVDEEYDTGEIISQDEILIDKNDTLDSLRKKVKSAEHKIYSKVIKDIELGKINL